MVSRRRKILMLLLTLGFTLAWLLVLLLPVTKRVDGSEEEYLCRWENGEETRESFSAAYSLVSDFAPDGIALSRNGVSGKVVPSAEYAARYETLLNGSVREVLALDDETDALTRTALFRRFYDRAWWSGNVFTAWTATGAAEQSDIVHCRELVVETSGLTASELKITRASSLEVRGGSDFSAKVLIGTEVAALNGSAPYFAQSGALLLQTAGGVRLVACPPNAEELAGVSYDIVDNGALIACSGITSLSLPFAGNTRYTLAEDYRPEIAALFLNGSEYSVPDTLKRVEIAGGVLDGTAFYLLDGLEEISLCGMRPQDISPNAFRNLHALRTLHTPRGSVTLSGDFTRRELDCGCTLYEREV